MARRTKEEAEQTRARILDAAERVFLEKGVSATSLEGIARAAGVTRGAIYWHFRDKGAILEALRDKVHLPVMELAQACRERPGHDPLRMVRELSSLVLHKLSEDEHYRNIHAIFFTRCEYTERANPRLDSQRAADADALEQVIADFERARVQGTLSRTVTPRVAALGLFSLLHGIFLCWLREPDNFDVSSEGEAMLDLFFAGLSDHEGGACSGTQPQ